MNIPTNWSDYKRLRLQYDEALHRVADLQKQYSEIQDQIIPGQNLSDKDRSVIVIHRQLL